MRSLLKLNAYIVSLALLAILSLNPGHAKADSTIDSGDLMGSGAKIYKPAIAFLKQEFPDQAQSCVFKPFFWETIKPGEAALGLVAIERTMPSVLSEDPGDRVSADILSVLVRKQQDDHGKAEFDVWLRVAAFPDSGWMHIDNLPSVGAPLKSPFRSCDARIVPDEACHECEVESHQVRLQLDLDDMDQLVLKPVCVELQTRGLGRRGVINTLVGRPELLDVIKESQIEQLRARLPSSSNSVQQSLSWSNDHPWPIKQYYFTPEPEIAEGLRLVGTLKAQEGQRHLRPTIATEQSCTQLMMPRPFLSDYGFLWQWEPLRQAMLDEFGVPTTDEGCLPPGEPDENFHVSLANDHLQIRSLSRPQEPVRLFFDEEGPYVFLDSKRTFFETLVASSIFAWANHGLNELDKLFPWASHLIRDVEIHQRTGDCGAQRTIGFLNLPIACPGTEGYTAKGLCGDVVLHELAHELTGSLVGLATGGWNWWVDDTSTLDEGLADYFALSLRNNSDSELYGINCQNDRRLFSESTRTLERRNLTIALLKARKYFETRGKKNDASRLALLAVLYGSGKPKSFIDEYLRFATLGGTEESEVDALCDLFLKHTGYCSPECVRTPCLRITNARLFDSHQLQISIEFQKTESCDEYEFRTEETGEIPTQTPPQQRTFEQLTELLDLRDREPPFNVVFEPCPEAGGEPQQEILTVSGVAIDSVRLKRRTHWLGAFASRAENPDEDGIKSRWLFTLSDNGRVTVRESGREATETLDRIRLQAGFTTTPDGTLQGWTYDRAPVSIRFDPQAPAGSRLQVVPEEPIASRPFRRHLPAELERPLLTTGSNSGSRLEILEFDAQTLTVGDWLAIPEIRDLAWEQPILPASVQIGSSLRGTVLMVEERLPRRRRILEFDHREGELEVVDAKGEWSVFPNEYPGVDVFRKTSNDGDREPKLAARFSMKDSICLAPPYLHPVGERFLVLSCDGKFALLDLSGDRPEWLRGAPATTGEEPEKVAKGTSSLPGIIAPISGLEPIQTGRFLNGEQPDWLVGPLLSRDNAERETYSFYVIDHAGHRIELQSPMTMVGPVVGNPAVADFTGDEKAGSGAVDEVLILLEDTVEIWQPRAKLH